MDSWRVPGTDPSFYDVQSSYGISMYFENSTPIQISGENDDYAVSVESCLD